jgi:hypothetical protein
MATRHHLGDVSNKLQLAVESFVDRGLARVLDDVEQRIAQQLANAGKPTLAIEELELTFLDLQSRIEDLEAPHRMRQATPEEYAAMARDWMKAFPGSAPPTQWRLPMRHQ